ncbi:ATP synthase F1 subunit epsilon [Candidatus Saccharibacteria bacterium]|nr:ATP synthase F1 subunit epsilon [Candidatus Saccharibacteria bacterium]MBI3338004.1 ATP synthase F1 subunit epsilon [Candidatus Saccharibacteria bacterium]
MRFELVSLGGVKFSDDVYEILLPTLDGQIGVLPDHMPLISAATHGVVSVRHNANDRDDMMDHFAISGGVVEVVNNTLRVLVDEADHADEISEAEAQKAFELAHKMKAEAKDQVSLEHAQSLVDRSAVRLQVAGLKRRHRR